jgi:N-acetyltransferase 10
MVVLQDFEALTPNLLARTVETVEGGGLVILLIKTVSSLRQLYTMSMDVHSRYRTEAHSDVQPRFNERFILSLAQCRTCLVLDDELNILPLSSRVQFLPSAAEGQLVSSEQAAVDPELERLKAELVDTPNIGCLVNLAKTIDQVRPADSQQPDTHVVGVSIAWHCMAANETLKIIRF